MWKLVSFLCVANNLGVAFSGKNTFSNKDFFYYQTDDGKVIQALLSNEAPVFCPPPPNGPNEKDIQFWHYVTGDKDENGQEIKVGCTDCTNRFVKGAPLFVYAHGWGSSRGHLGDYAIGFREAFAQKQEIVNIVMVNWKKLAPVPYYGFSVENVPIVGDHTANIINFLVEKGLAKYDDIHFAGHSLGSHVANTVSKRLTGGNILQRVFALDPALPIFESMTDDERISPDDGKLVVVIHTAIGLLGMDEPRGHVDFYPNSGKNQPGCKNDFFNRCSHGRANYLLAESIELANAFPACECDSWENFVQKACPCKSIVPMGWDTPMTATGIFYLKTNGESPFRMDLQ